VSHYRASWMAGSDTWKISSWPPVPPAFASFLSGPLKPAFHRPAVLRMADRMIPAGTRVVVEVHQASGSLALVVRADLATVFSHDFSPGSGTGEWKQPIFKKEWNVY
jgi:hypothetical protein